MIDLTGLDGLTPEQKTDVVIERLLCQCEDILRAHGATDEELEDELRRVPHGIAGVEA